MFHSQHSSDDESIGEDEYVPNEKKLKEITSIIEKVRASKANAKRKKLVDKKIILEKENSHQALVRITYDYWVPDILKNMGFVLS